MRRCTSLCGILIVIGFIFAQVVTAQTAQPESDTKASLPKAACGSGNRGLQDIFSAKTTAPSQLVSFGTQQPWRPRDTQECPPTGVICVPYATVCHQCTLGAAICDSYRCAPNGALYTCCTECSIDYWCPDE